MRIICSECGREVPPGTLGRCSDCGGVLISDYPDEVIHRLTGLQPGAGIGRYRPLLPVSTALPYLGEGNTPLVASRRLGSALGLDHLYFKHEGCNPSGAFKDRAGALVAALAVGGRSPVAFDAEAIVQAMAR